MMTLEKQTNYQLALEQGFARIAGRSPAAFGALGAAAAGDNRYRLPVLDGVFLIDLHAPSVTHAEECGEGRPVALAWQILALHYLAAPARVRRSDRWLSFADLPDARGYERVYRGRVIQRLCATAGRARDTFVQACERLGGQRVVFGDEGFRFQVFPALAVIVAWYDEDGEFSPSASVLYPDNVSSFLPAEDVVVLSEGLVGRLQGKVW